MTVKTKPTLLGASSRSSTPIVLELIGPSAAGKSSIVRAMKEIDGGIYHTARPRSSLGWAGVLRIGAHAAVRFAPQHWMRMGGIVRAIRGRGYCCCRRRPTTSSGVIDAS